MSTATPAIVPREIRIQHAVQREIGRVVGPLWIPLSVVLLRFVLRYRIQNLAAVREQYRRLREESDAPILICPNHLTLIDSALVAWALVPWWRYVVHFDEMPWNTPERTNYAHTGFTRALAYIAKCIPISRGGERGGVAKVLSRVSHLLVRGEVAVVFPEGGRSRTGRVTSDAIAWGVGRIIAATPGCRVLCVYARGSTQESWGRIPSWGDRIYIEMEVFEPKSDCRGARRSRDLAGQIVTRLARMEEGYFDGRQ